MKKVRGYIFSRSINNNRVPQHVQNIVIRDFCNNSDLQYYLSATEYSMKNCYLILKSVLKEMNKFDGIVFYSINQLPIEKKERIKIYKKMFKKSKFLFFAVENLSIKKIGDIDRIEKIIEVNNVSYKSSIGNDYINIKNFINDKKTGF